MLLYTRQEHGGDPVRIIHTKNSPRPIYKVGDKVFKSARQLLISLHGKDRHWTFDRYFHTGPYTPASIMIEGNRPPRTTLDLFGAKKRGKRPHAPRNIGIDLEKRSKEVIKLLFKSFGSMIFMYGYDPNDVIQEIFTGIIIRNKGKCPWDSRKSSFGNYVHIVCHSVLMNYHRKMQKGRGVEVLGIREWQPEGGWTEGDAGAKKGIQDPGLDAQVSYGHRMVVDDLCAFLRESPEWRTKEGKLAVQILPLASLGHTNKEISTLTCEHPARISKAMRVLKRNAALWGQIPTS